MGARGPGPRELKYDSEHQGQLIASCVQITGCIGFGQITFSSLSSCGSSLVFHLSPTREAGPRPPHLPPPTLTESRGTGPRPPHLPSSTLSQSRGTGPRPPHLSSATLTQTRRSRTEAFAGGHPQPHPLPQPHPQLHPLRLQISMLLNPTRKPILLS